MKCIQTIALSVFAFALSADAQVVDPLTTRWTFGAHEPYSMYRRMGKKRNMRDIGGIVVAGRRVLKGVFKQ